jgi:hypothetical protein
MDSNRPRFMRTVAVGALTLVGTLIFVLVYLLSGTISLDQGAWPVVLAGVFSSTIFLTAALGGGSLLDRLRDENQYASRKAKNVSYGLWFCFLGSGLLGVLFAGLFTTIGIQWSLLGLLGQLVLSILNCVLFTFGGAALMFLFERLAD